MRLLLGDCLDKLKELDDNSIDSIVTDPPYGLSAAPNSGKSSKGGFMGKKWDYDVPSVDIWKECLRVLKPGGHLLSFAGSRTYHRMAVRIEDAGFEIRDQMMWVYGSGFPKSMDISKQLDKRVGVEREVVGKRTDAFGDTTESETGDGRNLWGKTSTTEVDVYSTEAVSDLAKKWEGWGTALKPAHEPIVMARKPISEKTIVDNVLEWGTGGINIDESRIELNGDYKSKANGRPSLTGLDDGYDSSNANIADTIGRFPANVIFDEEAGKLLDEQSGTSKSTGGSGDASKGSLGKNVYGKYKNENLAANAGGLGDSGGASRFFYCPKISKRDRNEGLGDFEENQTVGGGSEKAPSKNFHPTVKPTDLMLYLIRLVTPTGGTTLDPFMGSGSTGKAAIRGGFDFVGIEREKEYMKIAEARIQYEKDNPYIEDKQTRITVNKSTEKFW
jgi:site-specific DNA-methyltransferase (adenine-specific)